jgi:large subunit ribosomal protein L3
LHDPAPFLKLQKWCGVGIVQLAKNLHMKYILGTKGRMTQVFDAEGRVSAATVITAAPMTVTQVKTVEKDGYVAAQVGMGAKKESHINKPERGHFKDLPDVPKVTREVRGMDGVERGAAIDLSIFQPGDTVAVSAISKAKGFQGVVKRHGFHGDMRTHGRKHTERSAGSIGGGGRSGGRVVKGMRMPGRMGGVRITVRNLKVLQVNAAEQTILISGAVPGVPGAIVEIRG